MKSRPEILRDSLEPSLRSFFEELTHIQWTTDYRDGYLNFGLDKNIIINPNERRPTDLDLNLEKGIEDLIHSI